MRQVEPLDEIKKKSFSQSAKAVVQSSDLICFQEQFCLLLSCCASNREAAMGNSNPCSATPASDISGFPRLLLKYEYIFTDTGGPDVVFSMRTVLLFIQEFIRA